MLTIYKPDGEPVRCPHCLRKDGLYIVVRDSVANIVCEQEVMCHHCNKGVQYWAYGNYEPVEPEEMKCLKLGMMSNYLKTSRIGKVFASMLRRETGDISRRLKKQPTS